MQITLTNIETTRRCGECQLCCKLVPVPTLSKPAGRRCRHQKVGKGCAVHAALARVSPSCHLWSCLWLTGVDTGELRRPDRAHYVVDPMPDYVTLAADGGEPQHIPVLQIWVDPGFPRAHEDPALRRYLLRRALDDGFAAIIRYSNVDAGVLFAPPLTESREWEYATSDFRRQEHDTLDVFDKLSAMP